MRVLELRRPRGTKDLLPEEAIKYDHVINIVKRVFESYGFDEAQTPAIELWSVLTAKCGEEVKRQVFKIEGGELGLRFDLTVGLARMVASNPTLPKPFKRYFISKAWRHEEPQSGRLREFWQADVDIVGVASPQADAEVLAVAINCLKSLGLSDFVVRISNRKILDTLAKLCGVPPSKTLQTFRAIDKLDKVGVEGVREELRLRELGKAADSLLEAISLKGPIGKVAKEVEVMVKGDKLGLEGLEELREVARLAEVYGYADLLLLDLSLARGLDYYTGVVFELNVKGEEGKVGSVAGGGRYDNLVELLGGPPTPATGISLGLDRLVEVLKRTGKLPSVKTKTKAFVATAGDDVREEGLRIAMKLRGMGVSCEVDLMSRKLDRQLKYVDSKGIRYVIIVGRREVEEGVFRLRDMFERREVILSWDQLVKEVAGHGNA
ncbi:MAG: histidine--tRNA ligase [Candidatus Nezhaarchaeota archaeon]|nr:histidine--tRNA ligase [Candidatus Nezhaarchaeota archaeon]